MSDQNQSKSHDAGVSAYRIGIDLDQSVIVDNGGKPSIMSGFKAFIMDQLEHHNELVLFHVSESADGSGARALLEAEGLLRTAANEGLGLGEDHFRAVTTKGLGAALSAGGITHFVGGGSGRAGLPDSVQTLALTDSSREGVPCFPDWDGVLGFFGWCKGFASVSKARPCAVTPYEVGGLESAFIVEDTAGGRFMLKRYPLDDLESVSRQRSEIEHLKILGKLGFSNVPHLLWSGLGAALFKVIEGGDGSEPDVDGMLAMLEKLNASKDRLKELTQRNARDARNCLRDYLERLKGKWANILNHCQGSTRFQDLYFFLITDLEQLRQDTINHFYTYCKREGYDLDQPFSYDEKFFGPSHISFADTLKASNGELAFLNFEHSGWDDSAKVIADFFHNHDNPIPVDQKVMVLDAFRKQRPRDENFQKRLFAVSGMVYVEWILSLLEIVDPTEMGRFKMRHPKVDTEKLLEERVAKAKSLRESYEQLEHICRADQLLNSEDDQ